MQGAVGERNIMMFGGVHMPGETDAGPVADQGQQSVPVGGVGSGIMGVRHADQGNMHAQHDEPVLRRVAEQGFDKSESVGADAPGVAVGSVLVAQPVHIIEHDEGGPPIFEGVGRGPEHAAPGRARPCGVGRGKIEVVIAGQVPPGRADLGDHLIVTLEKRVIVAHQVAQGQAEGGARAREAIGDLGAQIVELHAVGWLGIGEHHHIEIRGFSGAFQREVKAARGVWLMVDARQHCLWIARRRPACRLDDEDGALAIGGQGVAPGVISDCNVASVGDANSRQSLTCGRILNLPAQQHGGGLCRGGAGQ